MTDDQPMSWAFLVMAAGMWFYGLWPALNPERFRETCLRDFRPQSLRRFALPSSVIRVIAILWLVLLGLILTVGIGSHVG